jgi:ABC-type sulfate/molybdate transport systems ATPase subunit
LQTLIEGRTVLTISHRLSTLGAVDEIIVLHQGRIVEQGTFEELRDAGGVFAWLLAEQNRYNLDRRQARGRAGGQRAPVSVPAEGLDARGGDLPVDVQPVELDGHGDDLPVDVTCSPKTVPARRRVWVSWKRRRREAAVRARARANHRDPTGSGGGADKG